MAREGQVKVRVSNGEREALEDLQTVLEVDSPAEAVRAMLDAFRLTAAGRAALPLLVQHGAAAKAEAERRIAHLTNPATRAEVPPGQLWDGDPGVHPDTSGVNPSLPPVDARSVRARMANVLRLEVDAWARASVVALVESLAARARHARSKALEEALREDGLDGVVLGWRNPVDAMRALEDRHIHPGFPQRGRQRGPLPVAVAIGCGRDRMAALQSARDAGHPPEVRELAENIPAPQVALDITRRRLKAGHRFIDLHRLVEDTRRPPEEGE